MKRVTRDVDLDSARDLLVRAPRACVCFAGEHGPETLPVALVCQDGRYLAGVSGDAGPPPTADDEIVLLVDEGIHWFDLRAVYIRGRVRAAEAPEGEPGGGTWFEVVPLKTVAWDYGKLREVGDEA